MNQSKYRVWRCCMESCLVSKDLWDVVNGEKTEAPVDAPENVEDLKKWRQVNAKAEFVLKRTISHGLFNNVVHCKSAS